MALKQYDDAFYTAEDIQEILKIGKNSTYNLLKNGTIPSIKIGKQYRIPIMVFNDWCAATCGKTM